MKWRAFTGLLTVTLLAAVMIPPAATSAHAEDNEIRAFTVDSHARILASRGKRPFVIAYWSVSCTHCPKELRALGELRRRQPSFDVVLVATDTPSDADEARRLAAGYGLGDAEQWLFADEAPERLRFAIDRRWHGELPRTQFVREGKVVDAVSGIVAPARLEAWARGDTR